MTCKQYLIAFLTLVNCTVFAQNYKLGKVTIDELKEKVHPKDSSATAAILFKTGTTRFYLDQDGRWKVETIVNFKIKIYKKEGLEFANQSVSYYVGGVTDESLFFTNENTYNLEGDKIVKTSLKGEGEFKEQINTSWKEKKITLPNVKEGSIIEYTYRLVSPYINNINDWYFQKSIPINHVEYTIYIPKFFQYRTIITGFVPIDIKSEEIVSSNFGEMKYIYSKDDVPALKDESYVNNIDNYTSILKYELIVIAYPNEPVESMATDWPDVVKSIYKEDEFGPQLRKESYFESDITPLLAGLVTRDEKIAVILSYVKSRMNWNGKYGIFCKDGVKKAYQDKTGNVAEINFILTAMLRYANIEANPVLISTRDNGVSIFPTRTAFNYVISAVEVENDLILLDATNKNTAPNILPKRALNWFGRIIRKEGTSDQVDLMPKISSKENITLIGSINATGQLEGQIRKQYFDYNAYNFRDKYENLTEDSYLEKLEKKYDNIEVSEFTVTGKKEIDKPIVETFKFKHSNSVEIIGDKMYFSPLLLFTETENPFKQEKREYPIDFVYPFQDKYLVSISIPDGYAVESIPTSISIAMSDNLASFKFQVSNTDTKIQVSVLLDINTSIIAAEYYDELKTFFAEMIKKQTEKVVLKKI